MSKTTQATSKLRDLNTDELSAGVAAARDELFRLKLGMQTNQVAGTAQVGNKRREIARALTILRARHLGLEKQGQGGETAKAPAPSSDSSSSASSAAKATKSRAKKK